jgi:hypothetical protein
MARTILKGNSRIAPTTLKTSPIVRPTILNGSKINHRIGKRKMTSSAKGQHSTKSMHQRIIAINVFIIRRLVNAYLAIAQPIC